MLILIGIAAVIVGIVYGAYGIKCIMNGIHDNSD